MKEFRSERTRPKTKVMSKEISGFRMGDLVWMPISNGWRSREAQRDLASKIVSVHTMGLSESVSSTLKIASEGHPSRPHKGTVS